MQSKRKIKVTKVISTEILSFSTSISFNKNTFIKLPLQYFILFKLNVETEKEMIQVQIFSIDMRTIV